MIFFSHSSRIRILQLTFALVCSCSNGLITIEKHHLVPFCLLLFCILCLSIQINSFFFLDTQGTVADLGEGPGGGGASLFLDQTDARRAKKILFGDHPPPPPPYLRIWVTSSYLSVYWFTYLFTFFVCLTPRRQRCWPECRPYKKADRWIWNITKKVW